MLVVVTQGAAAFHENARSNSRKHTEVPEGQRKVIKERGVTLVVAKQEGKMYAFNNKCPHLGLSLKRGEITPANDRFVYVCARV